MKKTLLILFIGSVLSNFSFAQDFTHPVDYNNFIVSEMNEIVFKNLEYISQAVHTENFTEIERKRNNVLTQINSGYEKIKQQAPYEGGEQLQSESLEVMKMYLNIFNVDLKEANILKQTSKESFEAMEAYFKAQDAAEKSLAKAGERFATAQKTFAKKHNIEMTEDTDNELNKHLSNISKVNEYTRSLYLIYFKMSKYSTEFLDAVSQQDKATVEAKRKKLETATENALKELETIGDFNGDRDYLNKTTLLVNFYKEMASNQFVDLVKVVTTDQKNLTQDDVNAYNNAIQTYNTKIPSLTNDFNQAQVELLKKNVPKHKITDKNVKRT